MNYDHCPICGREHDDLHKALAHRRFEQVLCSLECHRANIKRRFACCDKADFNPCVCLYSFTCPTHGITHVGSHD